MKILLITDGITPFVMGGMQKHSLNLCKALLKSGAEVTLVHTILDGVEPNPEDVSRLFKGKIKEKLKIIFIPFPSSFKFPGHYLYRNYLYSKAVFSHFKPQVETFDFIYTKGFSGWYFIKKKRTHSSIPKIGVKFHGYEMYQPAPSFRVKLEHLLLKKPVKWINRNVDVVFSYGGKITDLAKDIGSKNILEIPSAVDERMVSEIEINSKAPPYNFVFLGRYERRKGIEELNKVLQKIENPKFKFHFIGPIPKDKQLKKEFLKYHGSLSDVNSLKTLLQSMDILICPSHSEGMPNVILEGMACGLAIIATDVGAVSSLVNGTNGALIKPKDIKELERVIYEFSLKSPKEIESMKLSSFGRILDHFRWDSIGEITYNNIENFIKK